MIMMMVVVAFYFLTTAPELNAISTGNPKFIARKSLPVSIPVRLWILEVTILVWYPEFLLARSQHQHSL
jgi:hypothetical protein